MPAPEHNPWFSVSSRPAGFDRPIAMVDDVMNKRKSCCRTWL
jgi:hypothetical protein